MQPCYICYEAASSKCDRCTVHFHPACLAKLAASSGAHVRCPQCDCALATPPRFVWGPVRVTLIGACAGTLLILAVVRDMDSFIQVMYGWATVVLITLMVGAKWGAVGSARALL